MFNFEKVAERRIQRALERGEFDKLPGRGAPVDLDDDLLVPRELRMGFRILKNAGISPREIQVLGEINRLKQQIRITEDKIYKQMLINQMAVLRTSQNL